MSAVFFDAVYYVRYGVGKIKIKIKRKCCEYECMLCEQANVWCAAYELGAESKYGAS